MTLGPYLKVLSFLIRVALREENVRRRDELLVRFADAADEDISHMPLPGEKKITEQPLDEPDGPDA